MKELTERQEMCIAHRRKHGLIANIGVFDLYCEEECPIAETYPLNDLLIR